MAFTEIDFIFMRSSEFTDLVRKKIVAVANPGHPSSMETDAPQVDQSNGIPLEKPSESRSKNELKTSFLLVVKNFSAVWWTVALDTGVLSIILHGFPFPSRWTKICSTIMFILALLQVCLFSTLTVLQWTLFFNRARKFIKNAEEIALQACPAIAWITITIQLQLTCAESWGYGFTILAYVLWWIELVWTLTVCLVLYTYLIENPSQVTVDKLLPTAVFVPIVSILTTANAAGVIINSGVNNTRLPDRLAVPIIIIGFMLVGFAYSLGLIVYSIYMHRLMTSGWPPSLKVPSMILTVGPCGQAASALLQLGNAAVYDQNFSRYARGFFLQEDAASVIRIMCVVLALFLIGFAVFWMCIDYYAILSGLRRRQIHPSLFWWSSIFPVGTVVTALSTLGSDMDSPALKTIATILFVFLFCIYVFNTLFTIPMTLSGELLGLPRRSNWISPNVGRNHSWAGHSRRSSFIQD